MNRDYSEDLLIWRFWFPSRYAYKGKMIICISLEDTLNVMPDMAHAFQFEYKKIKIIKVP